MRDKQRKGRGFAGRGRTIQFDYNKPREGINRVAGRALECGDGRLGRAAGVAVDSFGCAEAVSDEEVPTALASFGTPRIGFVWYNPVGFLLLLVPTVGEYPVEFFDADDVFRFLEFETDGGCFGILWRRVLRRSKSSTARRKICCWVFIYAHNGHPSGGCAFVGVARKASFAFLGAGPRGSLRVFAVCGETFIGD